tara:strand:+ start:844 stop:1320 length:477 start_codon:yes stop_codon:yes gene_type:complete
VIFFILSANRRNIMRVFIFVVFGLFFNHIAIAANETIEMLNKNSDGEKMVYSKQIVHVDVGDTVYWKATDKGHNVQFIPFKKGGVPSGVEKFKSKMNKDTEYTFSIPGIYAYWCTPHKSMGMIGFVIVGNDKSNLEAIKKIKFSGKSKKIAKKLIDSL